MYIDKNCIFKTFFYCFPIRLTKSRVFSFFGSLAMWGPRYWVRSLHNLAFGCNLVLFHCLGVHSTTLIVHLLSETKHATSSMFALLDGLDYVLYSSLLSNLGVALPAT